MIMLPTEDEMASQAIDAMLQKYYADHKEELDKMLASGLIDGFCACRISKDGDVKYLTRDEYEALLSESMKVQKEQEEKEKEDETDRV